MLETLAILLIILWAVGLVSSYTLGVCRTGLGISDHSLANTYFWRH